MDQNHKEYQNYIKKITPHHMIFQRMFMAFLSGGVICCFGQWIINLGMEADLSKTESASICSIILILISVILTGFGIFSKLAEIFGAGVLVPITGFANGVASSAMEYKKEGHVFGIGCKIFSIAGPVILYGITMSFLLGLIYYLITMTN